jgi:uncharacterized protein
MIAFRWGGAANERVGYFHPRQRSVPADGTSGGQAVLICNPFGQEALRAYRMLRVLADRLAREGHDVLRFDYYGTGDSDGDCGAFSLNRAVEDILAADDELGRRTNLSTRTWIGLRLGATLALRAAARRPSRPSSVLLWDPVVSGSAYLDDLARTHVAYVEHDLGMSWAEHVADRGLPTQEPPRDEAFGFVLTPELRAQMGALRLEDELPTVGEVALGWMSDAPPGAQAFVSGRHRWIQAPPRESWNSDEAVFSARIPQEFLVACEDWLKA